MSEERTKTEAWRRAQSIAQSIRRGAEEARQRRELIRATVCVNYNASTGPTWLEAMLSEIIAADTEKLLKRAVTLADQKVEVARRAAEEEAREILGDTSMAGRALSAVEALARSLVK